MEVIDTKTQYFKIQYENIVTKSVLPTIRMHDVYYFNSYYHTHGLLTAKQKVIKKIEINQKDFDVIKNNINRFEDNFSIKKITTKKTRNWERVYPYRKRYASRPESRMDWVINTFTDEEEVFGTIPAKNVLFEEAYKDAYDTHVSIFISTLEGYMNDDKTHSIRDNGKYDYYVDLDFNNEEIIKIITDHYYISKHNNICRKNCDGRFTTANAARIIKSNPVWIKRLYQIRENQ